MSKCIDVRECVTTSGAASMAGVTEGAVRAAMNKKRLPFIKTADGRNLIRKEDVDEWLATRKRKSNVAQH